MSLISMACHDTPENNRYEFTFKTVMSLERTVNIKKHKIYIINNGSTDERTKSFLRGNAIDRIGATVIDLPENIGTARAINLAWKQRRPGEHCIKIDNDIWIHESGWVERLEEVVAREPKIGQVGLKRKDLWETPWHEIPGNRCELMMLQHEPGQRWIIVEKSRHVMGTCVLHSSDLLDKVGYMYQPGVYGYDDTLMTCRAICAGFMACFLSHIEIDHIDPGGTEYITWKQKEAGIYQGEVIELMKKYVSGEQSYYHDFY